MAWLDILLRSGGRPRKLTEIVLQLIDAATMETTAKELCIILQQHGDLLPGGGGGGEGVVSMISLRTIPRGRKSLGWFSVWQPNVNSFVMSTR